MLGIVGVAALLTVLGLSLVITRLATTALSYTGMSKEAARFQARSAFTGTGFTTSEAETVVDHPVRRRIVMLLMVLRSAGLVSILISLILSFAGAGGPRDRLWYLVALLAGVAVLWLAANSRWVDRKLSRAIEWALGRWTHLDTPDYARLLKLAGDYSVSTLQIEEGDWLADRTLGECRLREEGVMVLGITRQDGTFVGTPKGDTSVYAGDVLTLYGRTQTLRKLDERGEFTGEADHRDAVEAHRDELREQDRQEAQQKRKQASRRPREQQRDQVGS